MRFLRSLILVVFGLIVLHGTPMVYAAASLDANTLSYKAVLKDSTGKALQGYFDIRVSLWKNSDVKSDEIGSNFSGGLNMSSPNYLGFLEEHTKRTDKDGIVNLKIGQYMPLPKLQGGPNDKVYFQVEMKPQGTSYKNWEAIQALESSKDRIGVLASQIPGAPKERNSFGRYEGALLGNDGKPLTGAHHMRFSLWKSGNFDEKADKMSDGALNSSSSNYAGYDATFVVNTDSKGRFSVPMGSFQFFDTELLKKHLFLQIEVKNAESLMSQFEIIDPDGDLRTEKDRMPIGEDGGIVSNSKEGLGISSLGAEGKWVVSQIPNGTSEKFFELGAGGTDTQAILEIRANQGESKKGVLRFNGMTKKWEISSDGITFCPINECILGTQSSSFTIGLGSRGQQGSPWSLIFGDTSGGRISFDAAKNSFSFSNDVDLTGHELKNAVLDRRATAPLNPKEGQQYFNTQDKSAYYFDGSTWKSMAGTVNNYTSVFGGGSTTIVQESSGGGGSSTSDPDGTTSTTFTINKNNVAGNTDLKLGTGSGQYLRWDNLNQNFELGKTLKVLGDINTTGNANVGGNTLNLGGNNTSGPGQTLQIVAKQGVEPNGILQYNTISNAWELSNNGGPFQPIATTSGTQTFTNKTIDGSQNTLTNISFLSLNPRSKVLAYDAQFKDAVYKKDGTNNIGALSDERDTTNLKNYYSWKTTQGTLNDLDVVLSIRLPEDFVSFDATPFVLDYRTLSTLATDNKLDIEIRDTTGALVTITGGSALVSSVANTWQQANITTSGAPTFTPGGVMTITLKPAARLNNRAEFGQLRLFYQGR